MQFGRPPIRHASSGNPKSMSIPPPSPGQAKVIWVALTGLAIALLVALVVGLFWVFAKVVDILAPVLWPLAVAGVVAYLLDPLVDLFERWRVPRPRAILLVFAIGLFIVLGLFASVVPRIVVETRVLSSRVPAYSQRLQQRVEKWINHPPRLIQKLLNRPVSLPPVPVPDNAGELVVTNLTPAEVTTTNSSNSLFSGAFDTQNLQTATGWAARILPRIGSWFLGQLGKVASWFGVLAGLALVPVYAFYFLLEKRGISSSWTDYLPVSDSRFKEELVFILNSVNNYLIAFFRGQVLVALCDGILYGIGFMLVGLPYAALIGIAAVFLTIIPFIGAMLVCCSALIMSLVVYGDWLHPLLVLGVVAIVQVLEGLFISPKIMGERVGLHPVTIIVAVMAGTTLLGGILGGILAIPLTAALRVLMFRYIWKQPSPGGQGIEPASATAGSTAH
jgi:predicted PurR-regulated permease PerM